MADKTVTIKIETVAGTNAGAKKVVSDLEREVLASQKRVQANSRATDRAILQSQKAATDAAKTNVKTQANEFIRQMKTMESEAKKSTGNIQSYLKSAFGGGLVGGAIGSFAGYLTGALTAQFAQIPSILKTQLDAAVKIAADRQNALKGLESISLFRGINAKETQTAVQSLRLVKAGILDVTEASTTLKNLLSSNFSLNESIKIIEAFSDTAAFGKSAALGFGEAIRSASEGIRNGNSILVDNVGLTKNLSQILKEAGFQEQDLSRVKDDLNVRQALFNGLIKEALPQLGDADKLTQGWTGSTSALSTAQDNLYAAVGKVIINNKDLIALTQTLTGEVNNLTGEVSKSGSVWNKTIDSMTTQFAGFVLDVTIGARRASAELRDLGNLIELVGNAMGFAMTVGAGDPFDYYPKLKANWDRMGKGSFTYEAQQDAKRLQEDYNRRRGPATYNFTTVRSLSRTPGGNRQLANPYDPNSPLYFGPKPAAAGPGTYAGGADTSATGTGTKGVGTRGGGSRRSVADALPAFGSMSSLVISSGNPQWDSWFNEMGRKFDVDPNVLLLQAGKESSYNKNAVSPKGARGFSQFMPGTAQRFGVNTSSVKDSIRGQAQYMGLLLSMFGGDYEKALAGYNAGEGAVQKFGGIPPFKETRGYVSKIREAYGRKVRKASGRGYGTYQFPDEETGLSTEGAGIITEIDLSNREEAIRLGEEQIKVYNELQEALFNLTEHSKEEAFWFDYKLGKYPQFNEEQAKEIANVYKLIDATEKKNKVEEESKRERERQVEEMQREQERIFEDTRRNWEDLLNDLANGNFKNIWHKFRQQMLDAFIKPASTYLAQLFGGGMGGGMQPAMAGGGFNLGGLFGGGGGGNMGPGGTPYFNPISQFAGGGGGMTGGGGILGMLQGAFGGGGRGAAPEPAAAAAGMPWLKTLGGSSPIGGAGGGFGGMLRGMGGGSMMAGIGSGLGQLGMIAGSAVGGKWGNLLSLTGMGASIGASFGPWGAAIGAGIGAGAGLISMLFMRDNSLKKLKEAAASEFGISVKDKDILKQLKAIGEQYFGKGQAGKNAQATVRTEEGMNILRAYAESTGQSGLKIDRLNYGDENWSGNQFRGQFGGFRARGGHVSAGVSYIVGERRPEVFTPSTSGTISPSVSMSDPRLAVVLAQVEEALQTFTEKFEGVSPDKVLMAGAAINPYAVSHAQNEAMSRDPRGAESLQRNQGIY